MSDREAGTPYRAVRGWLVRVRAPIALVLLAVGWLAWIDAEDREISPSRGAVISVDLIARGIVVSSGSHQIEMSDRPVGFVAGCRISLLGFGLAVVAAHRGRGMLEARS